MIMTSLKTLLFSTAAGPAGAGVGTGAEPAEGAPDFAALMGGVAGDATPVLPTAVSDQSAPVASPDVASPPTAAILTAKVGVVPAIAAEDAPESIANDVTSIASAKAAVSLIKPDIAVVTPQPANMDEPETHAATEEEAEDAGERPDHKSDEPVKDVPPAATLAPAMPIVAPPISVAEQAPTTEPAPAAASPATVEAATSPAPAQVANAAPEQAVPAPSPQPARSVMAIKPEAASGKIVPQASVTSSEPAVTATEPRQAGSATGMPSGKTVPQLPTTPAYSTAGLQPIGADIVKALTDVAPMNARSAKTLMSATNVAGAQPADEAVKVELVNVVPLAVAAQPPAPASVATAPAPLADTTDAPVPTDAAQPQPKAAHAAAPRGDAVSLLQFVRDHLSARATSQEAAPIVKSAAEAPDAPTIDTSAVASTTAPILSTVAPTQPTAAPTILAPAALDLSASLGAQVVDMGVQGQWIDGLARDIAGLSANGAQGRFQIDTQQLGPVQVAIRQDADGAAISLTVATKAAEDALRQDSDRLRLDAGLQAIRINEVKIERAPHVAEAARTDSQIQQQGSQSQGGQQQGQQASWQNMGQNANQSAQQGRWQGRENLSGSHKAGGDASVLNQADAGESTRDGPRARYA